MPVASASRWRMPSSLALPLSRRSRSSSSSWTTPEAMVAPLPSTPGGSSVSSVRSWARAASAGSSRPAQRPITGSSELSTMRRRASTAVRARRRRSSSAGEMRTAAVLASSRSRSPMRLSSAMRSARMSGCSRKAATASCRRVTRSASHRGWAIHRRSIRAPIGVAERSRMSTSATPSGWVGASSSRLRMVNPSMATLLPHSTRPCEAMCPRRSCFVVPT